MNGALIAFLLFLAVTIGAFKDSDVKIKSIPYSIIFPSLVFILIMVPIGVTYLGKEILSVKNNTMSIIGSTDGWLSFFGGFFGGIVAVGGVYWQVTRKEKKEKEKKEKDVKAYIKYILSRNSQTKFFYIIHKELGVFHRSSPSLKVPNPLINFNQEYINSNINSILSLKNGEEIIEINERLIKCSKLFDILSESKKINIEDIIDPLLLEIRKIKPKDINNLSFLTSQKNEVSSKLSTLKESIMLFSNLLYNYNNNIVSSPELKKTFKSNISNLNLSLEETNKYESILSELEIKTPSTSTSLIALNLLLELTRKLTLFILNVPYELNKFKIIDKFEKTYIEIYELQDLFFNLSLETFEISKKINEFFKKQKNNN